MILCVSLLKWLVTLSGQGVEGVGAASPPTTAPPFYSAWAACKASSDIKKENENKNIWWLVWFLVTLGQCVCLRSMLIK